MLCLQDAVFLISQTLLARFSLKKVISNIDIGTDVDGTEPLQACTDIMATSFCIQELVCKPLRL